MPQLLTQYRDYFLSTGILKGKTPFFFLSLTNSGCYLWGMNTLLFVLCTEFLVGGCKVLPGTFSLPCVWIIWELVPWAWTLFPLLPILHCDLEDFPGGIQSKCTALWLCVSCWPLIFISTVSSQVHIALTTSSEGSLQIVLSASFLAYLVFSQSKQGRL